jgi:hypothetical protein
LLGSGEASDEDAGYTALRVVAHYESLASWRTTSEVAFWCCPVESESKGE